MTRCDTGKLRNGMNNVIRPNIKGTTKNFFMGPPSVKGSAEPVMSKDEKQELEFIDSLINEEQGVRNAE